MMMPAQHGQVTNPYPVSEYQRQAIEQRRQMMMQQIMAQGGYVPSPIPGYVGQQQQGPPPPPQPQQQQQQAPPQQAKTKRPSFWPDEQPIFEVEGAELDKVDMYPQHKPIQRPNLRDPRRGPSVATDMWAMNTDTRPVAENPPPVPDNDVWGDKQAQKVRDENLARKNRIGRAEGQGNHERPIEPMMTDDGGRRPDQDQIIYPVYNRYMNKMVLPQQKTKYHALGDDHVLRGAEPVLSGLMMGPNVNYTTREGVYHDDNNVNQLQNYFSHSRAAAVSDKVTRTAMEGAEASKLQVPVIEPLNIVGMILQRCGIYEPQQRKDIHVHTQKNRKKVLRDLRSRGTHTAAYHEKNAAGQRAVAPETMVHGHKKKQEQLGLMVMHPTMTRTEEVKDARPQIIEFLTQALHQGDAIHTEPSPYQAVPQGATTSRPSIVEVLSHTLHQGDMVHTEPNVYQAVPQGTTVSRPNIMEVQGKKYRSDEAARVHNEPNVLQSVPQGATVSRPSIVEVLTQTLHQGDTVHSEPNVYQSVPEGTTVSRPNIVEVQDKKYKSDEASRVHNEPNVHQSVPQGSTSARPVSTGENTKPMNVGPMLMSQAAGTDAPAGAGRNTAESVTNGSKKQEGTMIMGAGAAADAVEARAQRPRLSETTYMPSGSVVINNDASDNSNISLHRPSAATDRAAAPLHQDTVILQTKKQGAHLTHQRRMQEGSSNMIQPMHTGDTVITLRNRHQIENQTRQQVAGFDVNSLAGRSMTERETMNVSGTSAAAAEIDASILQRWGNLTNRVPARDLTEAPASTMRGVSESTNTRRAFKE